MTASNAESANVGRRMAGGYEPPILTEPDGGPIPVTAGKAGGQGPDAG